MWIYLIEKRKERKWQKNANDFILFFLFRFYFFCMFFVKAVCAGPVWHWRLMSDTQTHTNTHKHTMFSTALRFYISLHNFKWFRGKVNMFEINMMEKSFFHVTETVTKQISQSHICSSSLSFFSLLRPTDTIDIIHPLFSYILVMRIFSRLPMSLSRLLCGDTLKKEKKKKNGKQICNNSLHFLFFSLVLFSMRAIIIPRFVYLFVQQSCNQPRILNWFWFHERQFSSYFNHPTRVFPLFIPASIVLLSFINIRCVHGKPFTFPVNWNWCVCIILFKALIR